MNLGERLLAAAERYPSAEAAVEDARRLTYAELLAAAQRTAGGLAALGVGPGSKVMTATRNRLDALVLYWATEWLGAVFVPVNWRLAPADLAFCAADAEAAVIVLDETSNAAASLLEPLAPIVHLGDDGPGQPLAELAEATARPEPSPVSEDEVGLLFYTSGTTGRPKGVLRTQRAEWQAALAHVVQCRYSRGERTLGVMPWYHTMGMRSLLAMAALNGALVIQPAFDAERALELVEVERISALYLAPTLFFDLVDAAERLGRRPKVAHLAYAGAAMTSALVERCRRTFEPEVFVNHYGSTEVYTFTIGDDQVSKPGCAGRPGLNERIRLVEPRQDAGVDDLVAPGETGQVIVSLQSPEAFSGYWHRPDADAAQRRDGWYFTGDLGRLDQDGDLWVQGRVDDMIITGGENVHPLEVEDVLSQHAGVRQVAVVGKAHPRLGEIVVAFVVADPGVDAATLDAFCLSSGRLAPFKRPREYRFVDKLPTNASGKLQRSALRQALAETPDQPPEAGGERQA